MKFKKIKMQLISCYCSYIIKFCSWYWSSSLGAGNFILAPIFSLISWFVWAYIVYFVGVKLFPDSKTKTTQFALLRAIGFSSAPGIIRIFGFNEELMTVTFMGQHFGC